MLVFVASDSSISVDARHCSIGGDSVVQVLFGEAVRRSCIGDGSFSGPIVPLCSGESSIVPSLHRLIVPSCHSLVPGPFLWLCWDGFSKFS